MTKRYKMSTNLWAKGSLFLSFLCLAAQGCKRATTGDAQPVVSVQAAHPQLGTISADVVADAVLTPIAEAAIQSKVSAPIRAFYVQRGAKVRAGQVLATLENQDLVAAALDNKGAYTAAQGAYTTASQQQIPQEDTQARLDLEQARATLSLDESIVKARSQLFAQGAIPGRDVDTARAAALQAQTAFEIAQQKYDSIIKVGHKASLETAEGQLASAKGRYLGAEAQLNYTSIRTPISGIVTDRPLFAGEMAPAGVALVTVMDTSVLIAKLHIAQSEAQQLALGSAATISVLGIDDPIVARVSLISPALDPGSTTVEVWLRVENANGELKAGTGVHAALKGVPLSNALLIPADAVQRSSESGARMVLVIASDGTARKKQVTVGIQTAQKAQILSGLTVDDLVITSGGYGLDDGTKVKVEAADTKPGAGDRK